MSTDKKKAGSPAGSPKKNDVVDPLAPLEAKLRGPTTGQDDGPSEPRKLGGPVGARRGLRDTPKGGLPALGPEASEPAPAPLPRPQRGLGPRPWMRTATSPSAAMADLLGLSASSAEVHTTGDVEMDINQLDEMTEGNDLEVSLDDPVAEAGNIEAPDAGALVGPETVAPEVPVAPIGPGTPGTRPRDPDWVEVVASTVDMPISGDPTGPDWEPRAEDRAEEIKLSSPVPQPGKGGPGTTQTPPALSGAPVGPTVTGPVLSDDPVVKRARNVAAAAPGSGGAGNFPWFACTDGSKVIRAASAEELHAAFEFVMASVRNELDATQSSLALLAAKVIRHATSEVSWQDATDMSSRVQRVPTYLEVVQAAAWIVKERTRNVVPVDTIALAEATILRGNANGIGATSNPTTVVMEAETPDEWRPGMLPPSGYRVEGDRLVLVDPPAEPAAPHSDTESRIEETPPRRSKMRILTTLGFGPIGDDVDDEEREQEMRARRIGIVALVAAVLVLGVAIGLFLHTANQRLTATDLVMSELQKAGEMARGLDNVFVRSYLDGIPMGIHEKNGRLTERVAELEVEKNGLQEINDDLSAEVAELEEQLNNQEGDELADPDPPAVAAARDPTPAPTPEPSEAQEPTVVFSMSAPPKPSPAPEAVFSMSAPKPTPSAEKQIVFSMSD